ncbi:MAG: hypothetical protein JWR37_4018 [Mycobacterium sp.]|nr:hypothetical protein [Mycobacterium sp.]
MKDESTNFGGPAASATDAPSLPAAVDRAIFQAELNEPRVREAAHTRECDAIAAAPRRLPMVEVDATLALIGPHGPLTLLEASTGADSSSLLLHVAPRPTRARAVRRLHVVTTQVAELSCLHSLDIAYAVFCQGPYDESIPYRDFMGWDMPWYSAQAVLEALFVGCQIHRHGLRRRGQRRICTVTNRSRHIRYRGAPQPDMLLPHGRNSSRVAGGLRVNRC